MKVLYKHSARADDGITDEKGLLADVSRILPKAWRSRSAVDHDRKPLSGDKSLVEC